MKHLLILLLLAGLAPQVLAQVVDPQNMIVENLYIATADAEEVPVSLLIRDNKLELVSRDEIPIPDGFVALDANAGFNTGAGDADRIRQYNLEASWRRGPFWLAAEYTGSNVDSSVDDTLDFSGYYVTASWILTGEMRDYHYKSGTFGAVPISRPAVENGIGAWEVATRWSSIDLNDDPVVGGEMEILSLGVSWWLSEIFNVNLNYRYIANDRDDLEGRASGANVRVLLKLR